MPVAGSAVTATRARVLIGSEIGHSWLVDRTIMDIAIYGRLVSNAVQNVGAIQVTDAGNVPQLAAGVRESALGADAGAALSAKLTDMVRVYAAYDGRFRGNFTAHTGTVGVEFRF